jgi:hypothetical protein
VTSHCATPIWCHHVHGGMVCGCHVWWDQARLGSLGSYGVGISPHPWMGHYLSGIHCASWVSASKRSSLSNRFLCLTNLEHRECATETESISMRIQEPDRQLSIHDVRAGLDASAVCNWAPTQKCVQNWSMCIAYAKAKLDQLVHPHSALAYSC